MATWAVWRTEAHKWDSTDCLHIYVPVGPQRELVIFIFYTGVQISVISKLSAPGGLKLTGFTKKSKTCPAAKINFFLPEEKRISHHQSALFSGKENVLGFDV